MASITGGHSPRSSRTEPPRPSQRRSHTSPTHPPRSSPRYPPKRTTPRISPDSAPNTPTASKKRQSNANGLGPIVSQRRGSMGSANGDRPPTPVSKNSLRGSQHSSQQGPQSALLLEKLQQERRTEIQRNLTRLTGDLSSSDESKTIAVTPEGKHHDRTRNGGDDRKKGLALKETEQTMSTLHKQNFDLKLELFHRRERQTLLEQRLEILEAAKVQTDQSNDRLLQELERRDKAVEEAVHMIVSLEARLELLLREREMVRQVEADKAFISAVNASPSTTFVDQTTTPKPRNESSLDNGRHHLARMPSFMSERSEHTENLRTVFLGTQSSLMSLSKMDSRAETNGFASPTMSILSETSFPSVYGHNTTHEDSLAANLAISTQGRYGSSGQRSVSMPVGDMTPSRPHRGEHGARRDGRRDTSEGGFAVSPLRTVAEMDTSPASHLSSKPSANDTWRSNTLKPFKTQPLPRPRDDQERPLGKHLVKDVGTNSHGLPPTPDTMASSSRNLRHGTEESLRAGQSLERITYPASSPLKIEKADGLEPGDWRLRSVDIAQAPSITAFTGRKEYYGAASYESRLPILRRPRSADETTISRHKNDWDSCSDGDDLCSEASSFDYWMREGLRPSHGAALNARNRPSSSGSPPDLFGFPSDGKKWQSGKMFGSLGGTGYYGRSAVPSLATFGGAVPASDAGVYGSSLIGTQPPRMDASDNAPPPAPHRRSSLRARTSAPGTPTTTRAPGFPDKLSNQDEVGKRSASNHVPRNFAPNGWTISDSANTQANAPPVSVQNQQQDKGTDKRHYPPHAQVTKQSTGRPLSRGITNLFRRSLGSSNNAQASASASVPATNSPFPSPVELDASTPVMGVPAWERRNDPGDDMSSATPPPIMRRRELAPNVDDLNTEFGGEHAVMGNGAARVGRGAVGASPLGLGDGLQTALGAQDGGASLGPPEKEAATQEKFPGQSNQGNGRRWFGLSRGATKGSGGAHEKTKIGTQ